MKRRTHTTLAALLVLSTVILLGSSASAQPQLERLVDEGQMSWLLGQWTATTDEGQTIALAYRWQLNKNMISVAFKMGDYSYQGMIFALPGTEEVVEVGVDSQGSTIKSKWDITWDGAISKREVSKADGATESMAIKFAKSQQNTMTVKLHAIVYGTVADDPWATLQFKRSQRPAAKQPETPARKK